MHIYMGVFTHIYRCPQKLEEGNICWNWSENQLSASSHWYCELESCPLSA